MQKCLKELSRLQQRASGKPVLEKAQIQQFDRQLSDIARVLASKVCKVAISLLLTFPHLLLLTFPGSK